LLRVEIRVLQLLLITHRAPFVLAWRNVVHIENIGDEVSLATRVKAFCHTRQNPDYESKKVSPGLAFS
jgi:hypothetical protein